MKTHKRLKTGVLCLGAGLILAGAARADLADGLVSYWPMEEIKGGKVEDAAGDMDMDALNLSDADVVPGILGNAISFDATRQTMLERIHAEGDPLPINQNENLTIAFWTKANAQEQFDENGNPTNDRRFFSEGATGNNNPLFNIGTANDGSNNGIDLFIRATGTDTLNHTKSVQEPLDGEGWHHIVWTQSGADSKLYVDGVLDSADFNVNAFAPTERFTADNNTLVNTTSIGGIRRGAPSHWITGLIDEVAVWSRALSEEEIQELFALPRILNGLVSHWPLEGIQGGKAEDVVGDMDLDAINLSDADVVPGVFGNALSFDATQQTMLERIHSEGDPLPVHQYDNLTISFWTNTNAQEQFDENGNPTNDRRFFSEGATGNNNPLFNIGTANDGSNNGIDLFIRATGTDTLNHTKSVQEPLDGEDWHHIVWTQSGADSKLYVDGVLDSADFNVNAFAPTERFTADNNTLVNTTSIGGIRRGAPSHWITGLIDEVAVWSRALSEDDVQWLFKNGIPKVPGDGTDSPPRIEVAAERLTVPSGQNAIITFEGNEDGVFTIDGVGEVPTEFGVGRVEVPITEDTEFTVTVTTPQGSASGSVLVHASDSVVPGWFLIDNFTDWDPGLLRDSTKVGRKEYWTDPSPNPAGFLTDLEGNQVLTLNQEGPETIFTSLQSMETEDSDTRTVYFRLRFNEADDRAAYFHVGLTNKSMRGDGFEGDTANDLGGFAVISRQESDDFGTISVGPGNDPLDFELAVGTWYKVWLDITNSPGDSNDTISIHVAEENGTRTTLIENAEGDRGNVINHDRFFIAARGENIGVESFYLDDVYVSVDGIEASDPLDDDDPNLAARTRGLFSDIAAGGGPYEVTLPILNIGQNETLTITGATLTGADADLYTISDPPGSLGPGESSAMTITFNPGSRTGGVLAFLELESNDESNPVVTVDLSAVVPARNGLIGHYRMNEAEGDALLDSAVLKHGTYVAVDGGSFGLSAAGLAEGTAVELSRAGQTGGGYAQARLSGTTLSSFSVSMWVQPDDDEQSSLFAKGEQGGTPTLAFLYNEGTVFWFNEDNELTDPVGPVPTGEPSHLTVAYTDENGSDPGADNLRIYINGEEVLNVDDPPAVVDNVRNPLLIGSFFGTLSFDGIIDDVQVYNKALTGEDAAFLFANPGQVLQASEDFDNDGLKDSDEIAIHGTNPDNPDSDGDGVLDGAEVAGGTDPLNADSDSDGLTDGAEIALGTDPTSADSDGDGVSDGAEVATKTDPNDGNSSEVVAAFTGLERAPAGSQSFAFDGVEIGWDGAVNVGRGAGVVGGFTNNADDEFVLASQQLMVNNSNIDVMTDPVRLDSPADAVVSVDVRVYQNSVGIENNDFIDLCILTSTDGVNYDSEICFLTVEGTIEGPSEENPRNVLEEIFQTDAADAPGDGPFVRISSNSGDIPAGTTHVRLRIAASNNSDSEFFFFDNIAFTGSTGEVEPDHGDGGDGLYYEQDFDDFANDTADLGDGSIIASNDGTNSVQNGVLRMTQTGINSTMASFVLPSFDASAGWSARFDFTVEHSGENTPADGFSFNYGAIPEGENFGNPAEEGYDDTTPHVSYQVDTWLWNDAATQDAGVGIKLTGTELVLTKAADDDANFQPNERVSGTAYLSWDPANGASFTTTGLRTNADFTNIATPGFTAEAGHGFSFLARTGGHNETVEIDNLAVGPLGSLGPEPEESPLAVDLLAYYSLDGHLEDGVGDSHGVGKIWLAGGKQDQPELLADHPAAALSYADGAFGQGVDLDGAGQYIETPLENEESFDFGAPDNPTGFTVSAWFRVDGFTKGWQALIAKGEQNQWRVHRQGSTDNLVGNGGNADIGQDLESVNDGQIHHIALVSDPANGNVRLYIDGVLREEGAAPALENNPMPMMIGQNPDTDDRTWDGLIDDVALWSRPLTEAEVVMIAGSEVSLGELAGVSSGGGGGGERPFDLLDAGFNANGAFTVTIPDGVTADIEYSTNLVDWEVIASGVSGVLEETDAGRLAAPEGYYRAR